MCPCSPTCPRSVQPWRGAGDPGPRSKDPAFHLQKPNRLTGGDCTDGTANAFGCPGRSSIDPRHGGEQPAVGRAHTCPRQPAPLALPHWEYPSIPRLTCAAAWPFVATSPWCGSYSRVRAWQDSLCLLAAFVVTHVLQLHCVHMGWYNSTLPPFSPPSRCLSFCPSDPALSLPFPISPFRPWA